jgi:hypothetical protein
VSRVSRSAGAASRSTFTAAEWRFSIASMS